MNAVATKRAKILIAEQSAEGVEATSGFTQLRWDAGRLTADKTYEAAKYFDGKRLSSKHRYVKSIAGSGRITIHADDHAIGLFLAGLGMDDVVVPASGSNPNVHTLTLGESGPFYTAYQQIGTGAAAELGKYVDLKLLRVRFEVSAEQGIGKLELEFACMQPAIVYDAADLPVPAVVCGDAFLWTEVDGHVKFASLNGGEAIKTVDQFSIEISLGEELYYGTSITPIAVVGGDVEIVAGMTLLADEENLKLQFQERYGKASPVADDRPDDNVFHDSIELSLVRGTGANERSVKFELPHAAIDIDNEIEASLDASRATLSVVAAADEDEDGVAFKATVKSGRALAY